MSKILIAIVSSYGTDFTGTPYRDRARSQRETWVPEVSGADVQFFLGQGQTLCGDEIALPVPDGPYEVLPGKTQAICQWALEHGYDFMLKCDDDTYVRPERLLEAGFEAHDYVGRVRGPSGDISICPAPYCSGFAYWLSAKAMKVVADAKLYGDDAEDRFVANVLLPAGIKPVHDERFRVVISAPNIRHIPVARCCDEAPLPGNDLIAACEFIGPQMYEVHQQWVNAKPSHRAVRKFPEGPLSDMCVVIKTFLRDGLMERCIDGLERFLPEVKIILVDDGYGSPKKNTLYPNLRDRGHVCIWLPFDSGFGAKANAAIPFCDRKYVLIGSDDFDFESPETCKGIEKMVKVLDGDPSIHIVSGRVNGSPYEALLEIGDGWVRETAGYRETRFVNGVTYRTCDLTVNFSLVRRECLGPNALHWDGNVPIGGGEHGSLFFDAKKLGLGVAVIEDAHIREMQATFAHMHPKYPDYRARARRPERPCFKARGIQKYFLMGGGVEVTP